MTGYVQINLREMINNIGEGKVKNVLSNFSCPLNKDVEDFLKHKSIEFSKQGIAITYLIFASYKKEYVLAGYFTLATKIIAIYRTSLSTTLRKRINKFSQYDNNLKRYTLTAPLIGQIGKNFCNNYNSLITGDELLKLACDKVRAIQGDIGGRVVYLECEDKEKLTNFYSGNGFVVFGVRSLDRDEVDLIDGSYLVQMLKYLS